jgi:hypothetical protein
VWPTAVGADVAADGRRWRPAKSGDDAGAGPASARRAWSLVTGSGTRADNGSLTYEGPNLSHRR